MISVLRQPASLVHTEAVPTVGLGHGTHSNMQFQQSASHVVVYQKITVGPPLRCSQQTLRALVIVLSFRAQKIGAKGQNASFRGKNVVSNFDNNFNLSFCEKEAVEMTQRND